MSAITTEQLKLLQEEVKTEKEEREVIESERNKVCNKATSVVLFIVKIFRCLLHQLQSQLQALQRQSAVLMTSVADDEKLTDALLQLEQVQKELQEEKSTNAAKARLKIYVLICLLSLATLLLSFLLLTEIDVLDRLRILKIK